MLGVRATQPVAAKHLAARHLAGDGRPAARAGGGPSPDRGCAVSHGVAAAARHRQPVRWPRHRAHPAGGCGGGRRSGRSRWTRLAGVGRNPPARTRARPGAVSRPDARRARRPRQHRRHRIGQDPRRGAGGNPARARGGRLRAQPPEPGRGRRARGLARRHLRVSARAAGRRRRHHALQLPGDGSDVDVSHRDDGGQRVHPQAVGEGPARRRAVSASSWSQAGYPPGIFSVVHGDRETVDALVDHPDVRAVGFVGSSAAARVVYARAAAAGKRALCLGGAKNAVIVVPDADERLTVPSVVDSFTGCAGQRCMAVSLLVAVGDGQRLRRQDRVGGGADPRSASRWARSSIGRRASASNGPSARRRARARVLLLDGRLAAATAGLRRRRAGSARR